MNHIGSRFACFACGVVINSFAIALITKGDMGTSQISSVPYVLSLRFPLSFGMMTFIMNMVFIALQVVLLRRGFHPVQLLQILVNVLFSAMIDVGMSLLSFLTPTTLWQRLLCVAAGCCIMGFGIVIEVSPNVLMVPGEGIVRFVDCRARQVWHDEDRVRYYVDSHCRGVVVCVLRYVAGRRLGHGYFGVVRRFRYQWH